MNDPNDSPGFRDHAFDNNECPTEPPPNWEGDGYEEDDE